MTRLISRSCLGLFLLSTFVGCGWHHGLQGLNSECPQAALAQNPMYVPMADREFVWNQLVDTMDNYFRIDQEDRVRLVGGVLTEGQITTFAEPGATLLEPWRRDSTPGFERQYSTLQSMRRRAVARVMPQADGGFLVEVTVYKDLEDVNQPEYSTIVTETPHYDGTIVRPAKDVRYGANTLGWIAVGRDTPLEQRILAELRGRLGVADGG
ncbi:MAG: hypothetical protein FJ276_21740 [Planctomycetes bacterium]|nr:hypothetical protein [Planctomycetota bacterium]